MKSKIIIRKVNFILVLNIIFLIYFFSAFLPLPWSITTGLDPSWSYAISQAAQQGLIFGKDIIFTYGPLGYLITGAVLDDNFLQIVIFRWSIYLLLFIIASVRIITLNSLVERILISISIAFALFLGNPYISVGIGFGTDYQILFIFLIILSFDHFIERHSRWLSLGIGAIAGFCTLTKLTLGIYILGAINLFLIVNIIRSLRANSKIAAIRDTVSLINSWLGAISILFIVFIPSKFVDSVGNLIIALSLSSVIKLLASEIQNRFKSKDIDRKNNTSSSLFVSIGNIHLDWILFYCTYFGLLTYALFTTPSFSILDYLKNSLEITFAYSSAMSTDGNNRILVIAISDFFVICCLLLAIAKEGSTNLAISLLFIVFLSFKHGFVRQDIHELSFVIIAPLITSIAIFKIKKFSYRKIAYYLFIYILLSCLFISISIGIGSIQMRVTASKLLPKRVASNLIYLADSHKLRLRIENEQIKSLSNIQLPDRVKNLVLQKTIDIIPWQISLVPANNLNWKPRPIFQSYSAYTTALDNRNFDSLSQTPRDYILYQFQSIDGRHPFFDEPKTFNYLFCNYQLSSQIPDFVKLPSLNNLILLEKLPASRCTPTSLGERFSISWNTNRAIATRDRELMRANIKFQYSLVGKIYKTLFRAPAVIMKVDYLDGSQKSYRIVPENSENGVIVSHLPTDDDEAMSFWQGRLSKSVRSFSFQTSKSFVYLPTIEVGFSSERLR